MYGRFCAVAYRHQVYLTKPRFKHAVSCIFPAPLKCGKGAVAIILFPNRTCIISLFPQSTPLSKCNVGVKGDICLDKSQSRSDSPLLLNAWGSIQLNFIRAFNRVSIVRTVGRPVVQPKLR